MNKASVLFEIAKKTRARVEERKQTRSIQEMQSTLSKNQPAICLIEQLKKKGTRIIAEVKFKSPSLGVIRASGDPVSISCDYKKAGAAAISVLTESDYFGGQLETLRSIRQACPETCLLQKDFIVDPYQIVEARYYGANAILLILSLLSVEQARLLHQLATDFGMSSLVEVHDENEMNMALQINAQLIGVNNRNLNTMEISLDTSRNLSKYIKNNNSKIFISESGIENREQIVELQALGYSGFLIGSSLMKESTTPALAFRRLLE